MKANITCFRTKTGTKGPILAKNGGRQALMAHIVGLGCPD